MSEIVSILIPTYNNPDLLKQCLDSLHTNRVAEDIFRVYVIDNGTTRVKDFLPMDMLHKITLIECDENRGWEGGLNTGLKYIPKDVEFVMFLNDDTFLPYSSSSWLHDMLQWFVNKNVGAVGPCSNVVMGLQNMFNIVSVPAMQSELLIGFCMLLRKSALEQVGGVDEELPGGDDFDLSIRLRDAGYKLIVDRGVFVFHHGFKTGERLHGTANVGGGWNSYEMQHNVNTALIKKHGFARWQQLMVSIGAGIAVTPYTTTTIDAEGIEIRKLIPKDGKVYELGCGSQLTTPDAIGVDMIRGGEHIDTINKTSVALINADVSQKLPFVDANVLIARHILEHMQNPISALQHWKDALLPGGLLIVAVPDDSVMKTIMMNKEHKHAYTKEFAIQLFNLVGFKNIHIYNSNNDVSFIITGEKL